MAEQPLFSLAEQRVLCALAQHGIPFMVVGLSAAVLQGAPVVTQDVDLWVRDLSEPRFRDALRTVGVSYLPPMGAGPPMLAGEGAELFDLVLTMSGLGKFDDEFPGALNLPLGDATIKVLPLERVLASKTAANRPKDQLVIPVLRNTIAARAVKLPSGKSEPQ